jgi:hypothetical protein
LDSEKTEDTFNSIFSKYGLSVETLTDLFDEGELYLGGSTVVKTYCDEMSLPIKKFTPSDLDFFVTTEEAYDKMVKLISGTTGYHKNYSYDNTRYVYMRNISRVCEYSKVDHMSWSYDRKTVQVCLLSSDNLRNIFDGMDVSVTKCLFDGDQYVMHADFLQDTRRMTFTIPSSVQGMGELSKVLRRAAKYEKRGFSCTYPEMITPTVAPKMSVTCGYPAITKKYKYDHWRGVFLLKKDDVPTGYGQYSLLISEIERLTAAGKQKDTEKIAELQKLADKLKDDLALKDSELVALKKSREQTEDELVKMTAKSVAASAAQGVLSRELSKLKEDHSNALNDHDSSVTTMKSEHQAAITSMKEENASIVKKQQEEIDQLMTKIRKIAQFVVSSD